jgi:hypothetical protein
VNQGPGNLQIKDLRVLKQFFRYDFPQRPLLLVTLVLVLIALLGIPGSPSPNLGLISFSTTLTTSSIICGSGNKHSHPKFDLGLRDSVLESLFWKASSFQPMKLIRRAEKQNFKR